MLIKILKLTLALALLAPTFAIASQNQKVDDCIRGRVPDGYENMQIILDRCDLTADDMPALVERLQNVSIGSLEFWDNDTGSGGIGDKGLEILMQLKNIHHIDLDRNNITDDGIKYLANSGIEAINLNDNFITSKGAALLAKFKFLKRLSVSGNFLGDAGAATLAKSESIDVLDVSNNHIGVNGAISLSKNNNIEWLFIEENNISDKGFIALMSMQKLESVIAGSNNISDSSIPAAAANTALNVITLDNNRITDAGVFEFIDKAKASYSALDFRSNYHISCKGINALKNRYGESVEVDSDCYDDSYLRKFSLLEKKMKGTSEFLRLRHGHRLHADPRIAVK